MRRAVVLVGLVGIVVAAALDRRGLGSWNLDADLDRLTAGSAVVLAAAGLLSLASSRRTRVVSVVLAVVAGTASAMAAVRAVATGLPGPSTGVLAAASAVVLVGVVARMLRDAFVVPAPGAVVVGTAGPDGAVVGMG